MKYFDPKKPLRSAVKRYRRLTQDKPEIIRKVMHNLHTSQFGEQQLRRLRDVYDNSGRELKVRLSVRHASKQNHIQTFNCTFSERLGQAG